MKRCFERFVEGRRSCSLRSALRSGASATSVTGRRKASGTDGRARRAADHGNPMPSRREVEATIVDVFDRRCGRRNLAADPEDRGQPVEQRRGRGTLAATKSASQVFVDGLESLAFEVARDFSADVSAVDGLAGCTPVQPRRSLPGVLHPQHRPAVVAASDERCRGGRAARGRRPADRSRGVVRPVTTWLYAGISSLILSPEFVYRTEIGEPVEDGIVRLRQPRARLAARVLPLGYDADTEPRPRRRGRAGRRRRRAGRSNARRPARQRADARLPRAVAPLHEPARHRSGSRGRHAVETNAPAATRSPPTRPAIGHSVTAEETDLPALATHYGLAAPSEPAWVAYGEGRRPLPRQLPFSEPDEADRDAAQPSRRDDRQAPPLRGDPPPPPDVAVDMGVPVPEGACKSEAYEAHASGTCVGCHNVIDGIGFGFERYDGLDATARSSRSRRAHRRRRHLRGGSDLQRPERLRRSQRRAIRN